MSARPSPRALLHRTKRSVGEGVAAASPAHDVSNARRGRLGRSSLVGASASSPARPHRLRNVASGSPRPRKIKHVMTRPALHVELTRRQHLAREAFERRSRTCAEDDTSARNRSRWAPRARDARHVASRGARPTPGPPRAAVHRRVAERLVQMLVYVHRSAPTRRRARRSPEVRAQIVRHGEWNRTRGPENAPEERARQRAATTSSTDREKLVEPSATSALHRTRDEVTGGVPTRRRVLGPPVESPPHSSASWSIAR